MKREIKKNVSRLANLNCADKKHYLTHSSEKAYLQLRSKQIKAPYSLNNFHKKIIIKNIIQ